MTGRVAHVRAVHPYAPAIAPTAIDAVSSRRAVSAAARVHAAVPTLPTIGAPPNPRLLADAVDGLAVLLQGHRHRGDGPEPITVTSIDGRHRTALTSSLWQLSE